MKTTNIHKLLDYIELHGHRAIYFPDRGYLMCRSFHGDGRYRWDRVPPTWRSVREWLGY